MSHNHKQCTCCEEHHGEHHNHPHHGEDNHGHHGCGCCGNHQHLSNSKTLTNIIISAVIVIVLGILSRFLKINKYILLLLYIIPYIISGGIVLKNAFSNIIRGRALDEHFLMSVATIGAFILGDYAEAVAVMLFFRIGELFESYASAKSRNSISGLLELRADYANLEKDSKITKVSPESVKKGDIILIKAGEKIPLDGIITEGSASVNTASLTGESIPKDCFAGDEVKAGCINLSGVIRVEVTKEFEETSASKIIKLTRQAMENSARSEKFITKFARVYTPCVVVFAVLLGIILSFVTGDISLGVNRGLVFLVVSCPCALVVSVPLCFFVGMGEASRSGILIKGGEYIEKLARCKTFVFDKTGTLTQGIFKVYAVHPSSISKEELIELTAYSEFYSNHPIARAISEAYGKSIDEGRISDCTELAGKGVSVYVDGRHILVGNIRLMKENNIEYKNCHYTGTCLHIAVDKEYAGHIIIADSVKENAKASLKELRVSGVENIVMLTGDNEASAVEVAESLGIDSCIHSLLPEGKLNEAYAIMARTDSPVAFVGDGINDAPVLAGADVGIAMGGIGSDAAIETADAVIMDDNTAKLARAVKISKETIRKAYTNIIFIIAVKLSVLVLGAIGVVGMRWAVFADVGSLVLAVINSIISIDKEK